MQHWPWYLLVEESFNAAGRMAVESQAFTLSR